MKPQGQDQIEILIAEDSRTQREMLHFLLENQGYRVVAAPDGRRALELLHQHRPALVISDVVMPELDGYGLCKAIKSDAALKDLPVILVTTLADPQDVVRGLECGADNYIRKPYEEKYLLSRIDYLLMNVDLRQNQRMQMALEIHLGGSRHVISAERQQILDLLVSTFEEAVRCNDELKQRESELAAVNEELKRAKEAAEAATRMKSDFLANMSHELRTPLNAIIGFSDVLKDGLLGELPPQQQECVADIHNAGQHLLSLINDILDLSKIEAGKMVLEPEPLAVDSLLANSLAIVKEKATAHRIRLDYVAAAPLGTALLDARKTKQIVYNLLSNGVKFTPDGGRVALEARRVHRAAIEGWSAPAPTRLQIPLPPDGAEEFLEVAVADSGIGIAAEEAPQLFCAFSQIDSSLAREAEGTGLGLVLVRRLVQLHGGALALASTPGAGSRFVVWLPWREPVENIVLKEKAA